MKLDREEKHRLRGLFTTQLQKCEQVPISFSPAKHRSTLIDNEVVPGASRCKVLPGTSDTPAALATLPGQVKPRGPPSRSTAAAAACSSLKSKRRVRTVKSATDVKEPDAASWTIYQSDFAATAAAAAASANILTHSPARVAAARRTLESSNEWAEIDRLGALKTNQEVAAKQQACQQQQVQHCHQLDQQIADHVRVKQEAIATKAADLAAAVADVEAHQQEQAAKAEAARRAAEKVKVERHQQVVAAEAARARLAAKKAREDAAMLAAAEKQLEAAKAAAAANAAAARQAADEAKASNQQLQEARKKAAQEQQHKDEELMRETIRTLQRQEEAREAALKAFHNNIAARSAAAGLAVIAESRARQEREDRLMAASEAKAKADAEAKLAADAAKRAAQLEERKASKAAAAAAKAAAQAAAVEEQAKVREKVQSELAEYQKTEALTAQQRRERNMAHRKCLEKQIVEAEERALLDDVFMAPKERALNRRLLSAARKALDGFSQA